jgi:surface antigen
MIDDGRPSVSRRAGVREKAAMPIPIKPLVIAAAALAGPAVQAQLLGPSFESNITLTREDLDMMRQTVTQQIHGRPVGTTAFWNNPSSKNSCTIKLLKRFTTRNMRCETIGYTLATTASNVTPEHYELNSCLQPDGSWKIL